MYTGAPYYAAQAALGTGADLVTIFTAAQAAVPLKCYSPEFMVRTVYDAVVMEHALRAASSSSDEAHTTTNTHWTIDDMPTVCAAHPALRTAVDDMVAAVTENVDRYHGWIVGPGMGRCPAVGYAVGRILQAVRRECPTVPVVLDADALWCVAASRAVWQDGVVRHNAQIILTPNAVEYKRLLAAADDTSWADCATILVKGATDIVGVGLSPDPPLYCTEPGGLKRSGGMGDILAGTTGTLAAWQSLLRPQGNDPTHLDWIPAAWTASHLVKRTTAAAWTEKARAMTAPDILERLGGVFDDMIGQQYNVKK